MSLSIRETGEQFALPEMVMFELTKHPTRGEETARYSLQYVMRCPEAVVITHSAKDLGQAEEASGKPTEQVVNDKMTLAWRKLLTDLRAGDGPDLDYFRWAITNLRKELRYDEYETDSRAAVQKLKDIAKPSLASELASIGRDLEHDRESFREMLVQLDQIGPLRDAHVRRGVPERHADALLEAPSVSYLFALAFGAVALEWTIRGGIESANPRRVANDILDIEYAIPALWIGRLVEKDGKARDRFEDLKVLGAATWPKHAEWFQRAKAISPPDFLRLGPAPADDPGHTSTVRPTEDGPIRTE